jgi:hypothetical protein
MNRSRTTAFNNKSTVATARIPRNVSLALKSIGKQHNVESVLVKGPNDPPCIRRDILVDKVVELVVTTSPLTVTYANVYAALDASGNFFFPEMRVSKISAFGVPSATTIPVVQVTVTYDGASFLDRGVGTARAPALHVRLPEAVRIQWVSTNSTTSLASVTGVGTIVQVTVQVRADQSGSV